MLSRFARAADPGPFAIGGCAHFRGEGRHNYHVVFGFITHGNEDGTLPAALRLLDELKSGLLKPGGPVTLLLGNPEAATAGVRFLEEDLNRVFTFDRPADSLERRRADEARGILDAADLFLDFHQTQTPTESAFWTFPWDPRLAAWARVAGAAPRGLTRAPGGIFSTGKCCLDEYVRARGKIGFTAEVGEKGQDPDQARRTHEAACRVLSAVDLVMSGQETLDQIAQSREAIDWYTTVDVGSASSPDVRLKPGLINWSAVGEGELLSPPEGPEIRAARQGHVLFPKYPGPGEAAPPELYRLAQRLSDPWGHYGP